MHSIFAYSFHKTLEPEVATPFNDNIKAWEKSKKNKKNDNRIRAWNVEGPQMVIEVEMIKDWDWDGYKSW